MPVIQGSNALTTGTTNDNVLSGSQFEYLPYPCLLEIGVNGSATGLLVDIYVGSDIICESFAVNVQNRFPVYPDDFMFVEPGVAGSRLKIRVRNPTGGTLTEFHTVKITPV